MLGTYTHYGGGGQEGSVISCFLDTALNAASVPLCNDLRMQ